MLVLERTREWYNVGLNLQSRMCSNGMTNPVHVASASTL